MLKTILQINESFKLKMLQDRKLKSEDINAKIYQGFAIHSGFPIHVIDRRYFKFK